MVKGTTEMVEGTTSTGLKTFVLNIAEAKAKLAGLGCLRCATLDQQRILSCTRWAALTPHPSSPHPEPNTVTPSTVHRTRHEKDSQDPILAFAFR